MHLKALPKRWTARIKTAEWPIDSKKSAEWLKICSIAWPLNALTARSMYLMEATTHINSSITTAPTAPKIWQPGAKFGSTTMKRVRNTSLTVTTASSFSTEKTTFSTTVYSTTTFDKKSCFCSFWRASVRRSPSISPRVSAWVSAKSLEASATSSSCWCPIWCLLSGLSACGLTSQRLSNIRKT